MHLGCALGAIVLSQNRQRKKSLYMERRTLLKTTLLATLAGMTKATSPTRHHVTRGADLRIVALGGAGVCMAQATRLNLRCGQDPLLIPSMSEIGPMLTKTPLAANPPRVWLLVAGLGGVTGTTLVSAFAEWLSRSRASVHAFVTLPFGFEGALRHDRARQATSSLIELCKTIRVFSNDSLFDDHQDDSLDFQTALRNRTTSALHAYYRFRVIALGDS